MKVILSLFGWRIQTNALNPIKKSIIIQAPHTSNWDFILGIITAFSIQLNFKFIIKKEWDKPIIGNMLRKIGAIFIDRSQKSGVTKSIIQLINNIDNGHVLFTPEGTRSKRSTWKTGFYTIAKETNIPICLAYIDYKKKEIGVHSVIYPLTNLKKDCITIRNFYQTVTPKNKSNYDPNWTV